ncbi:hypothetical protein V8B97DRAFT_2010329 [Scleroderma yunnanense]
MAPQQKLPTPRTDPGTNALPSTKEQTSATRSGTPPPSQLHPSSTPLSHRTSGSRPCISLPHPNAEKERDYFVLGTRDRFVGPMPVDLFIDRFLPTEGTTDIPPVAGLFDNVTSTKKAIMYMPLITAIEKHLEGFKVEDASVLSSTVQLGETYLKPDIASCDEDSQRKDEKRTGFSALGMGAEFKKSALFDPFDDAEGTPFEDTIHEKSTRSQMTVYATAQFGKQFRHFIFSVIILGQMARIVNWERAGATVTNAFNYVQNPEILVRFFHRFACLSRKDRGWDTSVTPIEKKPPGISLDVALEIIMAARKALSSSPASSLFWIQVRARGDPNADKGPEFRYYIGSRPCCPYSLDQRSTRVWKVYSVSTRQVVFLKDTWRIDANDIDPEDVTYRKLHEKNVRNIATVEAFGDVGYSTVTQSLTDEPWSKVKEKITSYRLVLKEVGLPLTHFLCTRDLVNTMRDAIIALSEALELAKILHRDISVGNIIIILDESGKFKQGLLIDWDLCKDITKSRARRRDRTGTWQFMSAALLRDVGKEHTIADDLESSLHVLTWTMLRYVPHSIQPLFIQKHLQTVFDEYCRYTGTGGGTKGRALAANDYIPPRLELKQESPLLELLRTLVFPYTSVYGQPQMAALEFGEEDQAGPQQSVPDFYQANIELTKSPKWLLRNIDAALKANYWPGDDRSSLLF